MITTSIFDFDGTIANTIPAFISILKKMAESHGMLLRNARFTVESLDKISSVFCPQAIPKFKQIRQQQTVRRGAVGQFALSS